MRCFIFCFALRRKRAPKYFRYIPFSHGRSRIFLNCLHSLQTLFNYIKSILVIYSMQRTSTRILLRYLTLYISNWILPYQNRRNLDNMKHIVYNVSVRHMTSMYTGFNPYGDCPNQSWLNMNYVVVFCKFMIAYW